MSISGRSIPDIPPPASPPPPSKQLVRRTRSHECDHCTPSDTARTHWPDLDGNMGPPPRDGLARAAAISP